jgi:tetratricopeptide (TPR) repeat protein
MTSTDPAAARYCAGCGTRRRPDWRFCPKCSHDFSREGDTTGGRRTPATGLAVFAVLVLAGVGMWLRILQPATRSGPPGSPAAASTALPEGHPPLDGIALPDDVKTFISNLVAEAEQKPDDAALWTRLSQVQYRAAQIDSTYFPAALRSFRHLLERDPQNPEALRGVANVNYDLGNYRDALPYFEKYVALRPQDHGAQTDLATVRLHLGEVEPAIAAYRQIIVANPSFVQAHYNLGVALHQTGDDAGALVAFRRAHDVATDARVRSRVEEVIANLEGTRAAPMPPAAVPGAPVVAQPAQPSATHAPTVVARTGSPFQQAIEAFFRTHEIVGPKVRSVDWTGATAGRVIVSDFPMAAMPPFARAKFTERIREAVGKAKTSHGVGDAVEIAIVDAASGAVMETVTE